MSAYTPANRYQDNASAIGGTWRHAVVNHALLLGLLLTTGHPGARGHVC